MSRIDPALAENRVADAPNGHWVYRLLPVAVWPYAQLARWDRPIGWWLLLWPCWWSAALAFVVQLVIGGDGDPLPSFLAHLALFLVGAVAMRGAGCTYNDIVDVDIDAKVARTRSRPLPAGRVTKRSAWLFLIGQALIGLLVLLQFNAFAIALGIASLLIVAIYPFAKRFTDWPQFFLGLAFSWGGLMGWAAAFGSLDAPAVALYAGAVAWTIGYDTIYAHQDKEDDALIGVRSTARLFGERSVYWIVGFYALTLTLLAVSFVLAGVPLLAYAGLVAAALHMIGQIAKLDIDDAGQCLKLFRSNTVLGWLIFGGLLLAALASYRG